MSLYGAGGSNFQMQTIFGQMYFIYLQGFTGKIQIKKCPPLWLDFENIVLYIIFSYIIFH